MPKKSKDVKYYEAVGRRKESVARVRLYLATKGSITLKGTKIKAGDMVINGKQAKQIFLHEYEEKRYMEPLTLTKNADRFAISIKVSGGGPNGQLEAIILGISRALCKAGEEYRPVLKTQGLLTRDPRVRERRKVGTGGKARRQKQSPKR